MAKTQNSSERDILNRYEKQPLDKIFGVFAKYKYLMISTIVVYILFNTVGLVMPWVMKITIDRVLPNADYLLFGFLCGALAIVYLIRFLLRYVAWYLVDYIGIRIMVDMRQKLFRHLQSLSLRFYQEYRTGKLISNVINDVTLMQMLMRTIQQTCEQIFQLLLVAMLLFFINWQMALVVVLTLPLHYINFHYFRKVLKTDWMLVQEKLSEISANLTESLTGVKVVKSFARENAESHRFFRNLRPIIELQMQVTVDGIYLWAINDTLTILTYLCTIGFGIRYVQMDMISIGEFVAFYSYVALMLQPVAVLSTMSGAFSQGMVGASRVVHLLNQVPEIKDPEKPTPLPKPLNGHIEFRDVNFYYKPDDRVPTIHDFNLTIKPGQKVALVGPSGSGKSTMLNLLLRFYDVNSGAIRVDNIDLRRLNLEEYRSQIGVVLQEPFLFSGSIRKNIAYAKPDATNEEIENAARLANVEEFVNDLPDGYETMVGENGATLSGGQKQRLAIARAILKNPSILIFDEATSALDTLSESLVQEALDRMMAGKTTIIIAHRLSTIRNSDVIVVMQNGNIAQQGTHDELVNVPGVYQTLYEKQRKIAKNM